MLVLRRSDLENIYEQCRAQYPNEACGILAGHGNIVEKVFPMTNAEPSPVFYVMDSQEQFRVMKEMRQTELDLVGIYHSHTGSRAFPSATDVSLAYYPDAVYLIVSLLDRQQPESKAFLIRDGAVTEVAVDTRAEGDRP